MFDAASNVLNGHQTRRLNAINVGSPKVFDRPTFIVWPGLVCRLYLGFRRRWTFKAIEKNERCFTEMIPTRVVRKKKGIPSLYQVMSCPGSDYFNKFATRKMHTYPKQ